MEKIDRQSILVQAARKLRSDFQSLSSVPHNQLRGQEAEKLVREFLNKHLPKRFSAGAGFILDPNDMISRQTDVVIYDALNCPVYRASEDAAIFPSDNVAAVVEAKSTLNKQELTDAWEKIQQTKAMAKSKPPEVPWLVQTQTMGIVFAFTSDTSLDTIGQNYISLLRQQGLGHHIDLIVVLDKGILTLGAKLRSIKSWGFTLWEGTGGPAAEGCHVAVAQADFGEYSLDAFLRFLLAHLIFFRDKVHHPGFKWSSFPGGQAFKTSYLTSISLEKDPRKREENLKRYRAEIEEEFKKHPYPPKGAGDAST